MPPSLPLPGRMLVAEDDPILLRFYQIALKGVCTDVKVLSDAESALQELLNSSFDFLITDLKLGGKNGIDIINQAVSRNPQVKVLVASGYVDDSKYQQNLAYFPQICGYLQKPFTIDQLLQTVRSSLGSTPS